MSALFLSSLKMSHYRSHRRAALELDGRPVAIYGPNGAGKTNILEAVSILSPGRGLRRASSEDMTRRPEAVGWKVSADLSSHGAAHEIETWSEAGAARQTKIDGQSRTANISWPHGAGFVARTRHGPALDRRRRRAPPVFGPDDAVF